MKNLVLASAVASAVAAPAVALAQAPAAPASPHTFSGNMTIASDYRFRGISQTFGEGMDFGPAIQGGVDYAHQNGLYIGNWNSSVSGNQYPNGSGIEMDFYGGWKKSLGDVGLDLGAIYYYYPNARFYATDAAGNTTTKKIDNFELYVGGSWKWFTAKYYLALTDYFGMSEDVVRGLDNPNDAKGPLPRNGDTKGTQYLNLGGSYEVAPKFTVLGSLGYTWVNHYNDLNYIDYKIGVTYDVSGWILGAALVGTDADKNYWYACDISNCSARVKDVGEATIVLTVGKSF
jgi:uncharacterized protein (TIGR02001 family)